MTRKITDIKIQKKNPNRISIFLDGKFSFGLSKQIASSLAVGQSLCDEKILELQRLDIKELGLQQAMKFLQYRVRSEYEVRQNLLKHCYSENAITQVITQLRRMNLVNDIAFANSWVENRSELKPKGKIALRSELLAKGIDKGIIEEVIRNINEEQLAYKAARKYSLRLRNLDWRTYQKKLLGFLSRRGFTYGVSKPVVKQTWKEIQK